MKEDFLRPELDVLELTGDLDGRSIFYIGRNTPQVVKDLEKSGYKLFRFDPSPPVGDLLDRLELLGLTSLFPLSSLDAIICDFDDGNVFEIFNAIHRHSALKMISFIIIGNDITEPDIKHAMSLGINDVYRLWDVNAADLQERIQVIKGIRSAIVNQNDRPEYRELNVRIKPQKRLFDILCSLTLIIILSPVMGLIALLIWLESKGPVIYVSPRVGTGYQIFNFYKFRSMRINADKELESLKRLNQYGANGKKPAFVKIQGDPRITRIGRFLRKSSLDELPQLFNVLKGDMSLVGNRPLPLYEAELLTMDMWAKRFLAPAGITGLWQVTKRGKKDMSANERMLLDVDYADKASFWFDLKILIRTLGAIIQKETV